jgi:hypothetical protein
LAAKGKDKEGRKQLKQGSTNISSFSAFVNLAPNMSYTPPLGSKEVYTVSSTWGPKMSNNKYNNICFSMLFGFNN